MPVVQKITHFYKELYLIGKRIPKRDRFGIHNETEKLCLSCLILSIEASLSPKEAKFNILRNLQIRIETLKHLVRLAYEVEIYSSGFYLKFEEILQEISKMVAGWLKYTKEKGLG